MTRKTAVLTVVVPDTTASKLLTSVTRKLKITDVNSFIPGWDVFRNRAGVDLGYRGKEYDVLTWKKTKPGPATQDDVRAFFEEKGFHGNIPAFLAWIAATNPSGFHATVPADEELFRNRKDADRLNMIYFLRDTEAARLYFMNVPFKCSPGETYVGFRPK